MTVHAGGQFVGADTPQHIAAGAHPQHLSHLTFPIIQREVASVRPVTDDDLRVSKRATVPTTNMAAEPAGRFGFAAVRSVTSRDELLGVVITGGDADLDRYASLPMSSPMAVGQ